DASTGNQLGVFAGGSAVLPDLDTGRFFSLRGRSVISYDAATFLPTGVYELPQYSGVLEDILQVDSATIAVRGGGEIRVIPVRNFVQLAGPAPGDSPLLVSHPGRGLVHVDSRARSIAYDPVRQRLLASLSSVDPLAGNRLAVLDMTALEVERSMPLGSEPDQIELSADGQTAWVVVAGADSIARVDPWNSRLLSMVHTSPISSIDAAPTKPDRLAVSRFGSLEVLDGAARRVLDTQFDIPPLVRFGNTDDELFGFDNGSTSFRLTQFSVGPEAVTPVRTIGQLLSGSQRYFEYAGGLLMSFHGPMLNASDLTTWGGTGTSGLKFLDLHNNRLYSVRTESSSETVI
ncbi:MAG: hypothetical protein GY953_39900, partial [bacterium]|nr:hypothetical protein [bacterium]